MSLATQTSHARPFQARRELGNSRWFGGHLFSFLATGATTGGTLSVFALRGVAGQEPPPHIHATDDEAFYLLAGEMEFQIGSRSVRATAGDAVLLPRGVEHSFRLLSQDADALLISAPAGIEHAFHRLSFPATELKPRPDRLPPQPEQMLSAFGRVGLTFRAPGAPAPVLTPDLCGQRRPQLGRSLWRLSHLVTPLILSDETQDRFALLEVVSPRGTEPPKHVHHLEDELFYLLEGEATFQVGDQQFEARAGDLLFLPRGVPHGFEIHSDLMRFLLLVTPGDFEDFYLLDSKPAPSLTAPPPCPCRPAWEEMIRACEPYGLELIRD
jgi:quercetin dioxygenase-like cupin family protein